MPDVQQDTGVIELPSVLRGLDRKIEFGLPDLEGRTHIFKIHAKILCRKRAAPVSEVCIYIVK